MRCLAADPKVVGTDRIGFCGVLHTWPDPGVPPPRPLPGAGRRGQP
jgi:hypothetical protein